MNEIIYNEREQIKSALKKIEIYIQENMVPRLKNIGSVSIEFGDKKIYHGSYVPEYEHSIAVYKDGTITYRTGGLILYFKNDVFRDRNVYDSWVYGKDLVIRWREVKLKLLDKIQEKETEVSYIANFEV